MISFIAGDYRFELPSSSRMPLTPQHSYVMRTGRMHSLRHGRA
jgi:hypothetical protein